MLLIFYITQEKGNFLFTKHNAPYNIHETKKSLYRYYKQLMQCVGTVKAACIVNWLYVL